MILALWTFSSCLSNGFVSYDDHSYVAENPRVQSGVTWSGIKWAFTSFSQANWHPLTWLSHMLDCQVYGLNPAGHHATSVLLHTINTSLLFVLLRKMTGSLWRSFFVAALFGIHPLHVESVAWISERKDVLSGVFFMLTLIAYARYANQKDAVRGRARSWYWCSVGLNAAGLMCKPMLVTLPFVLVLLDYWLLARISPRSCSRRRQSALTSEAETSPPTDVGGYDAKTVSPLREISGLAVEKIPFLVLAGASCIITLLAQKSGGTVAVTEALPINARFENALVAWCRYLGKLFWPADLAVFYPYPSRWQPTTVIFAALLLAGLTAAIVALFRRSYLVTGWFWFLGMLVPVIGLVQVGGQSMADRYTYLPSIGIFIAVVWMSAELVGRIGRFRLAIPSLGVGVVFGCFLLTRTQVGYWKNTETLFTHALQVTQGNYVALASLGNYELRNKNQPARAIELFERAIALKPDFAEVYNNLGYALYQSGRLDDATLRFKQAVQYGYDLAHVSLGVALAARGRMDEALKEFETAVSLQPDSAEAQCNLGVALHALGRREEAERHLRLALELHPHFPQAERELNALLKSRP